MSIWVTTDDGEGMTVCDVPVDSTWEAWTNPRGSSKHTGTISHSSPPPPPPPPPPPSLVAASKPKSPLLETRSKGVEICVDGCPPALRPETGTTLTKKPVSVKLRSQTLPLESIIFKRRGGKDYYTDLTEAQIRESGEKTHRDHVIECQVAEYVLRRVPGITETRRNIIFLFNFFNSVSNMNVTTQTINLKKWGPFKRMISDLEAGNPAKPLRYYLTERTTRSLSAILTKIVELCGVVANELRIMVAGMKGEKEHLNLYVTELCALVDSWVDGKSI
ncbi:hypothetical protein FJZ55_01260 [Candidatus Woesearchaeota archaeon]|nr:hypothetical protein [Candidatus Woesearchaeota archaeon]